MSLRPAPFAPGLPPKGSSSAFIGRDAQGNLYLLHWHEANGWEALGWVGAGKAAMPALHHPAGQDQGLIVGHFEIPGSGAPAGTEGAAVLKGGTRPADRHPEGVRALGTHIELERARIRRGLSELGYPLTADLIALLDPDLEMSAWELDQ